MQEQKTNQPTEEQSIKLEDAKLAIEIFKKAIEHRPFIKKATLGQEFLALSNEERLNESLTPRIGLFYVDEAGNIPGLFFRFVGDESPIVEAFFYPFEAILSFLSEARSYIRLLNLSERTDEEKERWAVERTTDMTIIMIDNFYRRAELMMDSFTTEVMAQWRIQNQQNFHHYLAASGNPVPRQKDKSLENVVKVYAKEVLHLWKYLGQTYENWQKIRFAEAYDPILKHWKRLGRMVGEEDWREYAKPEKFKDTPDDLLDKMLDIDRRDDRTAEVRLSEFATEHAARRVGLIKKHGVSDHVLNQRKKGVKATGYSNGQLFEFLKQGREHIAKAKADQEALTQENAANSPEQKDDSAQAEKVKSLEQKIRFVQSKGDESVEQNGNSAQVEKS